jgi:hypothetical protein
LLFAARVSAKSARKPPFGPALGPAAERPKGVIPVLFALAFTVAPHLQIINHCGCFSPFVGI